MPKNTKPNQITPGQSDKTAPTVQLYLSDEEDEDETEFNTSNRMTAAGGNLLYHAMIAKKASVQSHISEMSFTESIRSNTSVLSKVSNRVSDGSKTMLKRLSKRVSTVFGYRRKSSTESTTHGLYSDINFVPEELPKVKPQEASGSLSLKLRYTFMFIEWLIFCSMMPTLFIMLGSLFEKLFASVS